MDIPFRGSVALSHGDLLVETQIPVFDEHGLLFARIDIGWPEYRIAVDFEGKHHWIEPRQRDWDVERYASALVSRGCPKTSKTW